MKQWQYMIRTGHFTELELNCLGTLCWELCTMGYNENTGEDIYHFKMQVDKL